METFLNRTDELDLLDELWSKGGAQFLVLYGRRRVGKTELLARFATGRRSVLFEATDVRVEDQLRDLAAAAGDALDLGAVPPALDDWDDALALIAGVAAAGRTLIVLDEFQYLVRQEPGLGSMLSRWWRTTGSALDLVLVLSGSDLSFFADEVLGATAPLHGRRTADLRLQPFAPSAVGLFVPGWSAEDRIRAYAVWGGVPYYLSLVDPARGVAENILATTLLPGAPLRNEADYLIRMESRLRETALYGSMLRGIATGRTTVSEVAGHLGGADVGNVQRQLQRLVEVGLAAESRPLPWTGGRRRPRYRIADPFLRFWFRFVAPAGARVGTRERAEAYLANVVLPRLDEFVSMPGFEEICRDDLLRRVDASEVGSWWGTIQEGSRAGGGLRSVARAADGVAVDWEGRVVALASCRWTAGPTPVAELNKLRRIAAHLRPGEAVPIVIYSRNGVDDAIAREHAADPAAVAIVRPEDLFREA